MEKEINETGLLLKSLRDKVSKLSENNVQITTFQNNIKSYQEYLDKSVSAALDVAQKDLDDLTKEKSDLL